MFNYFFFFFHDILPLSYLLKAHKNTFSTQSNDLLFLKGSLLDILNSKNMACNLRYLMKTKRNWYEIYTHVSLCGFAQNIITIFIIFLNLRMDEIFVQESKILLALCGCFGKVYATSGFHSLNLTRTTKQIYCPW
jgi:hypothetical protein